MSSGTQPGRFPIGLAVLTLLFDTAENGPCCALIDDAQWLGPGLGTGARVRGAAPAGQSVVLLFAAAGWASLTNSPGCRICRCRGCRPYARELLASAISGPLITVRDRILAEAHGDPLALLELPRTAPRNWLAGSAYRAAYRCRAGSRKLPAARAAASPSPPSG